MKIVNIFSLVVILFSAVILCSCSSDDDEGGRQVLSSKDYIITVASHKLEGVVTSSGYSYKAEVFAVKKDNSNTWESLSGITGFEYENGYEYCLKIKETHYLDNSMGETTWTVYELLDLVSKEKKESEGLPDNFIPDWFKDDKVQ